MTSNFLIGRVGAHRDTETIGTCGVEPKICYSAIAVIAGCATVGIVIGVVCGLGLCASHDPIGVNTTNVTYPPNMTTNSVVSETLNNSVALPGHTEIVGHTDDPGNITGLA